MANILLSGEKEIYLNSDFYYCNKEKISNFLQSHKIIVFCSPMLAKKFPSGENLKIVRGF